MQSPVYLLIWVTAFCAAWLIWSLGIRKLILDSFRERLFELRFQLFCLGMDKKLDFDDPAYRSIELLFCGLLRFAHRVSFLTYIVSVVEQSRAKMDKDYVDVSRQIALRVSRLDPDVQTELLEISSQARTALTLYLVFSSLPLFTIIMTMVVLKYLGLAKIKDTKEQLSSPIEREAYCLETRNRRPNFAMA